MRRAGSVFLLLVFLVISTAFLFRGEIASRASVYLASQFGISRAAITISDLSFSGSSVVNAFGCYPVSDFEVCAAAPLAEIKFKLLSRSPYIRVENVTATDAEFRVTQLSGSVASEEKSWNFPSLPFSLFGDTEIHLNRSGSLPGSPSNSGFLAAAGSLTGKDGNRTIDVSIIESTGRVTQVKAVSSITENLHAVVSSGGRQLAKVTVEDFEWKHGELEIEKISDVEKYGLITLDPFIREREPSVNARWDRESNTLVRGGLQWKEPKQERHSVSFQGMVKPDNGYHADLNISHEATGMPGHIELRCNATCGSGEMRVTGKATDRKIEISKIPMLQSFAIETQKGLVSYEARLGWGEKSKTPTLTANAEGVTAIFNGYTFTGISGRLRILPFADSLDSVQVETIDAPIPVTNITTKVGFTKTPGGIGFQLAEMSANALGGGIGIERVVFGEPAVKGLLSVRKMDLGELCKLHKQDYVDATGTVSGTLPFTLTSEGLSVAKGEVSSDTEGQIRYLGEGSPEVLGPAGSIAEKALRDFRYSKISSELTYSTNGDLIVSAHLEGKSPLLNTTRPVVVNLSLQENLLELLRTLRIAEEVEREVRDLW